MGTLRRYELDGAADVAFERLSGGQQARLQILLLEYLGTIIAISHDRWLLKSFPRFLVFGSNRCVHEADEPTWG